MPPKEFAHPVHSGRPAHPVHSAHPARPDIAAVFDACAPNVKAKLLGLRRLIFETAARTQGVGPLEETLKWGQPSYLTTQSGSGSTIRIDRVKPKKEGDAAQVAIYFHCQTTLVDTFRGMYGRELKFEGNRAIVLDAAGALPAEPLRRCIALALTYHRDKRARIG